VNVTGTTVVGLEGEYEMLAESGEFTFTVWDDVAVLPEESVVVNTTV